MIMDEKNIDSKEDFTEFDNHLLTNTDFDNFFIGDRSRPVKSYAGTFLKDELNGLSPERNKFYIINIDKLDGNGTHWVLVSNLNDSYILYIDSFANPPPDVVVSFMERTKKIRGSKDDRKPIFYNNIKLQDDTSINCGWYVLYFINNLLRRRNIVDILSDFELNSDKFSNWMNEKLIEKIKQDYYYKKI